MSTLSRWRRKRLLRSAIRRNERNRARLEDLGMTPHELLKHIRSGVDVEEAFGMEDVTDEEYAAVQAEMRRRGQHTEAAMLGRMLELRVSEDEETEEDADECLALATAFINRMEGSR